MASPIRPHGRGWSTVVLGLAWLAAGCGGTNRVPVVPVSGQVFVGSRPAEGALVVLRPVGNDSPEAWPQGYPRATVAADGSFRMGTYGAEDGAPVGDYAVLVMWQQVVPGANADDPEAEKVDRLNGQYADPQRSSLRASVQPPKTDLSRFDLPEVHRPSP